LTTGQDLSSPPETRLTFDRTVPRSIAHRQAVGEVFVTDSAEAGDREYVLAIQVPRAHSLWFDRPAGHHDTLSAMEAARQGTFVVVHRYLDIAVGVPFSLQRVRFDVVETGLFADDERSPLQGVVRYRLVGEKKSGTDVGSMSFTGTLMLDDEPAMEMSGDIVFMPDTDYDMLRAYQRARKPLSPDGPPPLPPRLDPARVGRRDERNVVIGEPAAHGEELWFPLVPDRRHPAFFDHAYDHVPGPFAVEGFRQAALVAAVRSDALDEPVAAVTRCAVGFSDFAEFEGDIECSALVTGAGEDGRVSVTVGLHQFGDRLADGEIELSPYD
jgi:hypothetical protein